MRRVANIFFIMFVLLNSANLFAQEDLISHQNSEELSFEDEFEDEFAQQKEIFDPLESYNRVATDFNHFFYKNILIPTAKVYGNVVNKNIRIGISNAYENILFPIRFTNNLLQFKFKNTAEETARFILNSTFGLFGLIDVAKKIGLEQHDEDFGQTLGFYGVGSGPHIVIPFLGPSNLRDIVGFTADSYLNPLSHYTYYDPYEISNNWFETVGYQSFAIINDTSLNPDDYENLIKDSIDIYPFLRDVYEQRRDSLIKE